MKSSSLLILVKITNKIYTYIMLTIKLPYESDYDFSTIRREYSSMVRYAYNRFLEGERKRTPIEHSLRDKFNQSGICNSWVRKCSVDDAKSIWKKNGKNKVIFGGKQNFLNRLKGKISKEEFQEKRLLPLNIIGEANCYGNRMIDLDITENKLIFKLNKKEHYELRLPKIRGNWKKKLETLEHRTKLKLQPFQVRIDSDFVYITFEEPKRNLKLKNSRYIGIDLNPKNIGVSIIDNGEVLETREYKFDDIINKIQNLKESSDSKKSKYLQNKLNHELIQVSKNISNLAEYYRCKFVFVEDLKLDKNFKSKSLNRLNRNLWKRNKFIENLERRISNIGGFVFKVNPAYSSFIGNLQYDYTDPINASIEIARRGFECIIKKNKQFYPELTKDSIKDQWKEYLTDKVKTWKDIYSKIKNSKLKYRVPSDSVGFRIFQSVHARTLVYKNTKNIIKEY